MGLYGLYFVSKAKTKPGKAGAAGVWWREKGKAFYESLPGVKSVRVFATQFGLGDDFGHELWVEIASYAVMDQWDEDIVVHPDKYGPIFREFDELFESGPSRLMGDWPESHLTGAD